MNGLFALMALLVGPARAGEQPTNATLTVVPVYEGMASYVDAARTASQAALHELFKEHVVRPYWESCAAGGEYIELAQEAIASPIADLTSLSKALDVLQRADLLRDLQAAFDKVSAILPGSSTTVCVLAANPRDTFVRDSMRGIAGFTAGAGKVWLQITPEGTWREWLGPALAHEYHHSEWTKRHFDPTRSLDLTQYLLFEGRADSFARLTYPDRHAPWTEALTPAQEIAAWKAMRPHLQTTEFPVMSSFIFGGNGDIPRWAGYTVGFRIVQAFLKLHPSWTIERWTALDEHDLLKESGYAPN
jgi:uncharacterized protein YjaZ